MKAEPLAVESYFRSRVESMATGDTTAFLDKDMVVPGGPLGNVRALLFVITQPGASDSRTATMLAGQTPGGGYQALMQLERSGKRVPPLTPPRSPTAD